MNTHLPSIDQASNCLTHFGQGADSRLVDLWREQNGREVGLVTVEISDLHRRHDLVARMSARVRDRLLPPAMSGKLEAIGCRKTFAEERS